ncbi:hypothetical protein QJQ45_002361 [Haematococcus lacustris]|nr:hypothetical protein QJQ45_002361 [Haematococcus lacustris]
MRGRSGDVKCRGFAKPAPCTTASASAGILTSGDEQDGRNDTSVEHFDRELEAQPEPSQAQKNKKASGEARRDRHDKNTWHAKKAKRHTVMRGVCAAGLEAGAVVASEVVEAAGRHATRGLGGGLQHESAARELATGPRAELAVIPNLADRNMCLQLCRGLPPPGRRSSQPSAAVEDVLALYPGLHARLKAVPRYEHDSNTVDDGKEVTWLEGQEQGQGGVVPTEAMRDEVARQRRLLGVGEGVVVNDAWLERAVNRGSLLRHAVGTSRQLEAANVSWQADWADWQAAGGQRNTRPYRPPSPFALTPGCSCKAHHIKLDTRALYGLMRTAGMLPADITS